MGIVIFESFDNRRRELQVADGITLMKAAVTNGIDGIEAECGGSCTCATCHIYVDERFIDLVPAAGAEELEMLEFVAAERKPNSRLSCQIVVGPHIDGLVVRLPETQSM